MAEIQDNMFVFENLGGSDDRSLQTLLRSVDQDVLVVAMKGADAQLQEKLWVVCRPRHQQTLGMKWKHLVRFV